MNTCPAQNRIPADAAAQPLLRFLESSPDLPAGIRFCYKTAPFPFVQEPVFSVEARLTVRTRLRFTLKPENQTVVHRFADKKLKCAAVGLEAPRIKWIQVRFPSLLIPTRLLKTTYIPILPSY